MLVAELHTDAVRYYCEIVQWVQSQTFQELTQAVYEQFPAFAKRSVMPGARFTALAAEESDPVKRKSMPTDHSWQPSRKRCGRRQTGRITS